MLDFFNTYGGFLGLFQESKNEFILDLNLLNPSIYSDSELIVKQVNGEYRVKNDRMKLLHKEVISLLSKFETWSLIHILRDKNKVADKLANDGRKKVNY